MDLTCIICNETKEENLCILECGKIIHKKCIEDHRIININSSKCPHCDKIHSGNNNGEILHTSNTMAIINELNKEVEALKSISQSNKEELKELSDANKTKEIQVTLNRNLSSKLDQQLEEKKTLYKINIAKATSTLNNLKSLLKTFVFLNLDALNIIKILKLEINNFFNGSTPICYETTFNKLLLYLQTRKDISNFIRLPLNILNFNDTEFEEIFKEMQSIMPLLSNISENSSSNPNSTCSSEGEEIITSCSSPTRLSRFPGPERFSGHGTGPEYFRPNNLSKIRHNKHVF